MLTDKRNNKHGSEPCDIGSDCKELSEINCGATRVNFPEPNSGFLLVLLFSIFTHVFVEVGDLVYRDSRDNRDNRNGLTTEGHGISRKRTCSIRCRKAHS